jgi:hypothetical protein
MENNNHVVVSHKLFGFQGRVGGRVVVMAPKFGLFVAHFLSSTSKGHSKNQS